MEEEYFKLDCRNKNLTELNNLSDLIQKIDCGKNKLVSLDNLPESLEILLCDFNPIVQLDNLPSGLKKLNCLHTKVINLNNLPLKLYELNCHYCEKLESLENLPSELKILDCSKLFKLHYSKLRLPQKLEKLIITNNWCDNHCKQIKINGKEINLNRLVKNILEISYDTDNKKEILKEYDEIVEYKVSKCQYDIIRHRIEVLISNCIVVIEPVDYTT